jgi:sensor histidine kinase regulating citrate/malate metabolism
MIIGWIHKMFLGSLRRQLILGVAIVNTVMMGWFVMDATHRQEVLFLDRQAEQATALAEALATASNHWLAANDISGLQELIEAQRRYPELRFAMLLDNNGRILAHTDRSHIGQDVRSKPNLSITRHWWMWLSRR